MTLLKQIPNLITLSNLSCGLISIFILIQSSYSPTEKLSIITYLMLLGMFFDFFDGFLARILKAYSDIGKQLDSLADMVTFGVLPSCFFYQLFQIYQPQSKFQFISLLLAVFACWRLAKFNIDTKQTKNFIGLPTPAMALWVIGLYYISKNSFFNWILSEWSLVFHSILLSFLMVLPIDLFSLKLNGFGFKENKLQYFLLVLSLILLITFQLQAFVLILMSYILLSILFFRPEK
ncbi:MAG: CDP-diacylglycerol--serine O-phosphatidyltransferase [Bacteroidetes bacterium]|nr:MAG: CDP-diacylglycerol--serine O-phosphatidyltransferase [Bacteroidota bacterium]